MYEEHFIDFHFSNLLQVDREKERQAYLDIRDIFLYHVFTSGCQCCSLLQRRQEMEEKFMKMPEGGADRYILIFLLSNKLMPYGYSALVLSLVTHSFDRPVMLTCLSILMHRASNCHNIHSCTVCVKPVALRKLGKNKKQNKNPNILFMFLFWKNALIVEFLNSPPLSVNNSFGVFSISPSIFWKDFWTSTLSINALPLNTSIRMFRISN